MATSSLGNDTERSITERTPLIQSTTHCDAEHPMDEDRTETTRAEFEWSFHTIPSTSDSRRNLKTFSGVFSPVALSMFSTVLFLRLGFIVGQTGIILAIVQFVMAYCILYLTILSICAISTNGAVEGGGAYYMISRALGPEFGGSIGFLFFLANILACGLYVSAFVEGLLANFGPDGTTVADALPGGSRWWTYLYATLVLLLCFVICVIGGSMFARTSIFILIVVQICVASVVVSMFVVGAKCVELSENSNIIIPKPLIVDNQTINGSTLPPPCAMYTGLKLGTFLNNTKYDRYERDYTNNDMPNFATVFAILFSSVTGIMNGANMSGELKNPSKSIPRGTLAAPAYTFVTYIILAFFIAFSCKRDLLVNDNIVLQHINVWPPFVLIGMFACTLSAALGNLIGASRVLEAVAKDKVFWNFLNPATQSTRSGNPVVAVIISWALVQVVLLIGSVNAIAPLTSAFFLLSYAATNLACLALDLASAPNFRPTFRWFSWHTALLGLICSLGCAFLVTALYTSVAIIAGMLLVIALHLRSFNLESWGSISQALIFHQVRKYLLMLDSRKDHIKFWRPQVLLLVKNPRTCIELMDFVNDVKKGGLYILAHVKVGDFDQSEEDQCQAEMSSWLSLVDHLRIKAFPELTMAPSVRKGMHHLARVSGLGGMKPNTVCLGFPDDVAKLDALTSRVEPRRVGLARLTRLYANAHRVSKFNPLEDFPPPNEESPKLELTEFVTMLADVLKLNKNLCVCRGFQRLRKDQLAKSRDMRYVDVWPLNFTQLGHSAFDTTSLFMLQLACILHMVAPYKTHTSLRVLLCVDITDSDVIVRRKEEKLRLLLDQLRIKGEIRVVNYDGVNNCSIEQINELMTSHSRETALTFVYLPAPTQNSSEHAQYLAEVATLTSNLPPTVMVHGVHPVTSTTL